MHLSSWNYDWGSSLKHLVLEGGALPFIPPLDNLETVQLRFRAKTLSSELITHFATVNDPSVLTKLQLTATFSYDDNQNNEIYCGLELDLSRFVNLRDVKFAYIDMRSMSFPPSIEAVSYQDEEISPDYVLYSILAVNNKSRVGKLALEGEIIRPKLFLHSFIDNLRTSTSPFAWLTELKLLFEFPATVLPELTLLTNLEKLEVPYVKFENKTRVFSLKCCVGLKSLRLGVIAKMLRKLELPAKLETLRLSFRSAVCTRLLFWLADLRTLKHLEVEEGDDAFEGEENVSTQGNVVIPDGLQIKSFKWTAGILSSGMCQALCSVASEKRELEWTPGQGFAAVSRELSEWIGAWMTDVLFPYIDDDFGFPESLGDLRSQYPNCKISFGGMSDVDPTIPVRAA
jgi:hypothetical protein